MEIEKYDPEIKQHGYWIRHYANHNVNLKFHYVRNKKFGKFTSYNNRGELHNRGHYINDQAIGYYECYHSKGVISLTYRCLCISNENTQFIYSRNNHKLFGEQITWK